MIATSAFYREAKAKGLATGKAASIPFIAAGMFLLTGTGISYAIYAAGAWAATSPETTKTIGTMASFFLMIAYLYFIRRYWIALSNSGDPSREKTR